MTRTDEVTRLISAPPARVFAAFIDPEALTRWLPPQGMTARIETFDARAGGQYRMVLTYRDATDAPGKSSAAEDIVAGRFVEVTPGVRLVQEAEFESDDPLFAGVMRMTWQVSECGTGSEVVFRADDVPDGISAEDHVEGLSSSLANLAAYLEG